MKLLPLGFLCATLCGSVQASYEYEYRLNVGLFTDHYINDRAEYNEENNLIQLTGVHEDRLLTVATFNNSHFVRSYLLGYGRERRYNSNFRYGGYITVIKGYEGRVTTHYKGLLFTPTAYANYRGFTINVMPAAYSIGIEIDF